MRSSGTFAWHAILRVLAPVPFFVGTLMAAGSAATAAPDTSWLYSGARLQYLRLPTGRGVPPPPPPQILFVDYDTTPSIGAVPFDNGIRLFGTGTADAVFSLQGDQYVPTPLGAPSGFRGNQLHITGTGAIDGAEWDISNDVLRTAFDFGFAFDSGALALLEVRAVFVPVGSQGELLPGAAVSVVGFPQAFAPGSHEMNFTTEGRFLADITAAVSVSWFIQFRFDWTGQGPDDTLTFSIPQNSLDIEATTVPAPGAAGLAVAIAVAATRRRRGEAGEDTQTHQYTRRRATWTTSPRRR